MALRAGDPESICGYTLLDSLGVRSGERAVSSRRGAVYLATAGGRVVALAPAGGQELWRGEARTDPGGAPADVMLIGDALYGVYGYAGVSVFSQDITKHPPAEDHD